MSSYEIADEPSPEAGWENLVFPPSAPLLSMMWCGAWLAWPWFIVNARAMGSPTLRHEAKLVAAGLFGSLLLAFTIFTLVDAGVIESRVALQFALLAVTTLKLGVAYTVSAVQSRTYAIYQYYGGSSQRAFYVLMVGSYVRALVLGMSAHPIWLAVMS
ncbi:MAG: hypothetical protein HOV81_36930 [Kofleriaceae bacterium]|nr:hypothetical protein [Kofleriaceae bacterium]